MKYVIDSSVGLKWVISEIANALASAEKSARIQPGEAVLFFTDTINNSPIIHEATPLLWRGLEISLPTRQSVYDCLYVSLAEREKCELVTADDKLVKNLGKQFPFIRLLASLP